MALSRLAAQFAAEIKQHDWSDAPFRADQAGHDRELHPTTEPQLEPRQTEKVRANAAWVTAQVLAYNDPNFNEHEFFRACGLDWRRSDGSQDWGVTSGLRFEEDSDGTRRFHAPGTRRPDPA